MAQDSTATDSATQSSRGNPAARLKEVRARLAEFRRRIRTERDPKNVADLRAEFDKLTEAVSQLVMIPSKKVGDSVIWPRDLSAEPGGPGEWGDDPEELSRG